MLQLKLTAASCFQNVINTKTIQILLKKKNLFIGRGQQLHELQNKQNQIIDLSCFDSTLSRVHGCFKLSPAWFNKDIQKKPKYLCEFQNNLKILDQCILDLIWQFLKPKKILIIKDLKSKLGIFKKITKSQIQSEMIIQFVHGSFITVLHLEKYLTFQQFQSALNFSQQQVNPPLILGNSNKIKSEYFKPQTQNKKLQLLSFWRIKAKQKRYILLTENNLILKIGRSSHCDIQIKDTAISRYQAHLKCQNKRWNIIDGNQIQGSKNGTWIKCKSIKIPIYKQNQDPTFIKIGTIQCEVKLYSSLPWLNVSKIMKNQINTSNSFIRIGFQTEEQTQNYLTMQQKLRLDST